MSRKTIGSPSQTFLHCNAIVYFLVGLLLLTNGCNGSSNSSASFSNTPAAKSFSASVANLLNILGGRRGNPFGSHSPPNPGQGRVIVPAQILNGSTFLPKDPIQVALNPHVTALHNQFATVFWLNAAYAQNATDAGKLYDILKHNPGMGGQVQAQMNGINEFSFTINRNGIWAAAAGLIVNGEIYLSSVVNVTIDDGTGNNNGGNNPDYWTNIPSGTVVARFETERPPNMACPILVHGTLPVPAKTFPRSDGNVPFAIMSSDGSLHPANHEIVSYYPHEHNDGADVLELAARVDCDSAVSPGQPQSYPIVYSPYPPPQKDIFSNTPAFLAATPGAVGSVKSLLQNQAGLILSAKDSMGNTYESNLYFGDDAREVGQGAVRRRVRTAGVLKLVSTGNTNSGCPKNNYEHFLGYIAFLEVRAGEPYLGLDLMIYNGWDDHNATTPMDNNILDVLVDHIAIGIPKGLNFNLVNSVNDPFYDGQIFKSSPTHQYVYLLKPTGPGVSTTQDHFFGIHAQTFRNLALAEAGSEQRAKEMLDDQGIAFAQYGKNANGDDYLSWSNSKTARLGPARLPAPKLLSMNPASIRAYWQNEFNQKLAVLTNGATNWLFKVGVLGWAAPAGDTYGGTTGGTFIDMDLYGLDIIRGSSRAGYRDWKLFNRGVTDRHGQVYRNLKGDSTTIEDNLINGLQNFSFFSQIVQSSGKDPFHEWGYDNCVKNCGGNTSCIHTCQNNYPAGCLRDWSMWSGNALTPDYMQALKAYSPLDDQHFIRVLRQQQWLAWIGNDPIAKEQLLDDAEIARMSMSDFPGTSGAWTSNGVYFAYNAAKNNPGQTVGFGRDDAWRLQAGVAGYSISSSANRARLLPWLEKIGDTLYFAQDHSCHYNIPGDINAVGGGTTSFQSFDHLLAPLTAAYGKGIMRATKMWEEDYLIDVGVSGLLRGVFEGFDPTRASNTKNVIKSHANFHSSDLAFAVFNTPADQTGISMCLSGGGNSCSVPYQQFCTISDVPTTYGNLYQASTQGFTMWSDAMFGHAYYTTNNPYYLVRAANAHGMNDPCALYNNLLSKANQNSGNLQNKGTLMAGLEQYCNY